MNFIAMDFETANRQPFSACSLALVVVRDNQVVNHFYTLINPQTEYNYWNTKVNGITTDMTKDAPDFSTVWPHIASLFTLDQLVVAHNARFDINVLQASLARYQIEPPHFKTLDTVRTSRQFYPQLPNHKLNTVSDYLQINLQHHHHALADSYACAEIVIKEQTQFGTEKIKPLITVV